ncbi:hypothetical protein [Neisseria musculi]|uniref:Uncharacterized protein n=1 Tax=Neisseria musculi TaxID=1815583 RepID=A0A7H1MEU5_9NEIS|nr:hypothetical protein [Neisseria musculi]QNT60160.1 hypothetical protein H7A79_1003 [Neisseria musculi]
MTVLTQEMKVVYAGIIQKFYDGALRAAPEDITPEAADIVDQMLNAVKECSKAYLAADAVFSVFYGKTPLTGEWIWTKLGKDALGMVGKWRDVLYNNRRYRSCVVAVALRWRSPLQIVLLGI